jgi:hypothetical protein
MKIRYAVLALVLAASAVSLAAYSIADDEIEHRGKRGRSNEKNHEEEKERGRSPKASIPVDSAYAGLCGGCHWAYAPQLLPRKSWESMLASLDDHFASEVKLTEQERRTVAHYLLSNAADVSSSKLGRKVARSLGGAAPSRVVEVPYIQKKHRKLAPEVFARKGVGGLANCIACHPGAASLDFEDDRVSIPAK